MITNKIDLSGIITLSVGYCPICRGTTQNPEQPEGELCSACNGTGAIQQTVSVQELFETFRDMLRNEERV